MRARAAGGGTPPEGWYGEDGAGNAARQEMLRQVAMVQAMQQSRRN